MPKQLIITLREGVDPVYGLQKAPAHTSIENETLSPGNYRYILMPEKNNYAKGVHALRTKCEKEADCSHPLFVQDDENRIYRPLTFKENIEARVNDFNTLYNQNGKERKKSDRLRFFSRRRLDSCTGIAYKGGSTKFKLISQSRELITLPKEFNNEHIAIDYDSLTGVELDTKEAVYNNQLTRNQVENHPAWLAVVDGDSHLLKAHTDIVFNTLTQLNAAMSFYVRQDTAQDELRALFVYDLVSNSDAVGLNFLSDFGSFLLVAPSSRKKKSR